MRRRTFLHLAPAPAMTAGVAEPHAVLYESPDPAKVFAGSAGLARLPSGTLIATMNLRGPGLDKMRGIRRDAWFWSSRVYTSADRGATWKLRGHFPMNHARPFTAGRSLYILGHGGDRTGASSPGKYRFAGDLAIMRSDDGGATWGEPVKLTEGQEWHQAPCNVIYARDRVYLVMERVTDPAVRYWSVSVLAPVVMSARVADDLTRRESWTFSNELTFVEAVRQAGPPRLAGIPFFPTGGRMAPIGWLETNLVQFTDPDHVWYDPAGRTFHLWMRAHTGGTNLAAIAKAVESADGRSITVSLETAPSGETMLYVPCPGGHMKFHILYDEKTSLYWLLSSQSTDSMRRPDRLPEGRYGLPNNERHRLALHFSKNCVDWCFAGMVADGGHPRQARHYASMVIDGEDIVALSRSGDARARSAHDGNLITAHKVRNFRSLVY